MHASLQKSHFQVKVLGNTNFLGQKSLHCPSCKKVVALHLSQSVIAGPKHSRQLVSLQFTHAVPFSYKPSALGHKHFPFSFL